MKFGSEGLQLMAQIAQILDLDSLQEIFRSLITGDSAEDVQPLIGDKIQKI